MISWQCIVGDRSDILLDETSCLIVEKGMLSTRAQWSTWSSKTLYSVVGSWPFGTSAVHTIDASTGHGIAVCQSVGGAVGKRYS